MAAGQIYACLALPARADRASDRRVVVSYYIYIYVCVVVMMMVLLLVHAHAHARAGETVMRCAIEGGRTTTHTLLT